MTFDGKKENWSMWSEKILAKATLKGYEDILNGKIDVPKGDEENYGRTNESNEIEQISIQ